MMVQDDVRRHRARPLKIAFASSEVAGFAKTGGLADVAAALPSALSARGHEVAVLMPLYCSARAVQPPPTPVGLPFAVTIGNRTVAGSLWEARLPDSRVRLLLVGQPDYFERDDPAQGRSYYQYTKPDGRIVDYADNCERFVFFNRAILEAMRLLDFWPDVLHANDWHTGLAPVYLRQVYARQAAHPLRPFYARVGTLFTIHNVAYQGNFWHHDLPLTGLHWSLFNHRQLEFHNHLSFLKAGIVFADRVNAVSPTYAREIQTPYYGCGMQGALYERGRDLSGIVNGVDYRVWDPATDPHLPAPYDAASVAAGKAVCKQALQQELGLPVSPRVPLLGMISRLTPQKGLDLLQTAAEQFLRQDAQLVVLGQGEPSAINMLRALKERHPDKMAVRVGYNEALAHRIEAGADIFLMPSLYEPCGLNQMYSLRYGAVPVVRRTGGLADTVTDANPEALATGTATGFAFEAPSGAALLGAVERATEMYRSQPAQWLDLVRTGMSQDWSWDKSAGEYEALYRQIVKKYQGRG